MEDNNQTRECTPCTACCEGWLQININGEKIGFGNPCRHRIDAGCGIHETRPVDPCRLFICGWLMENSPLPDWMRPDVSKIIFQLNKYVWEGQPVDAGSSVGETIPAKSLEWLKQYTLQNGRSIIITQLTKAEGDDSYKTQITVFGSDTFGNHIGELIRSGRFSLTSKNLCS